MAIPLMKQIEGKYEILEKMGEGGMGAVYKVRHRLLEEVRVIKVMRPQLATDPKLRARFLREAKTAIKLRHPNVAQLFDCTVDDAGNAYMVMEFIEGVTLEQILEASGVPPIGLVLEVAIQSLAALGSLHKKKVIHRDIAPDNLMLTRDEDDGGPLVKLIDLGIAKVLEADVGLTATGIFVGKLRYASPEHFQQHEGASVDARSDLYSFGIVLYELLTGTHPIVGESMSALIAGHLFHKPLEFAKSDPGNRVPEDLRSIILRSLAKKPEQRFQSSDEFASSLSALQDRYTLTADDLERALALAPPPTMKFPAMRGGKTQEELDRQFAPAPTPPPDQALGATPPPVPQAKAAGEAPRARPEAPSEADLLARRVEDHIQRGELTKAGEVLAHGERQLGGNERLFRLRNRLDELRRKQERHERIEALRHEAASLVTAKRYEEAESKLEELLGTAPSDTSALAQLDEVRRAVVRINEAAAAARRQIDAGRLDEAEAAAKAAAQELGEVGALREIMSRIASERAAVEQRTEEASALIAAGRSLLAAGRLDEAREKLQQATSLDASAPAVASFSAELSQATREADEQRRRADQLHRIVEEVERFLASGNTARARTALEKASRRFPGEGALEDLGRRLDRAEVERRKLQVEALRGEASRLLTAGSLEAAEEQLRKASALDPNDPETAAELASVRRSIQERRGQEERDRAVANAAQGIRAHLEAGRVEEAHQALETAVAELGDDSSLQDLRPEVEKALSDLRRRRGEVDRLLGEAAKLSAADDLGGALELLLEAARTDPSDGRVQPEVERTEAAIHQREEERRRSELLAAATTRIDDFLSREAHQDARRELAAAVEALGSMDELAELNRRIDRAEAAERAKRIQALAEEASRLGKEGRHDEAVIALEEARSLAPDDTSLAERLAAAKDDLKRQKTVEKACADVNRLLAAGKVRKADRRLTSAEAKLGPDPALDELRQVVQQATARIPAGATARPPWLVPLLAVAGALVVVVAVVVFMRVATKLVPPTVEPAKATPGATAAPGTVVVNAHPWGTITGITDASGEPVALPQDATTPAVLTLPPGTYTISLSHPSRTTAEELQVTVKSGVSTAATANLETVDLDNFFGQMGW